MEKESFRLSKVAFVARILQDVKGGSMSRAADISSRSSAFRQRASSLQPIPAKESITAALIERFIQLGGSPFFGEGIEQEVNENISKSSEEVEQQCHAMQRSPEKRRELAGDAMCIPHTTRDLETGHQQAMSLFHVVSSA